MKGRYKRGCHPNSRKNSPFVKGHKVNVGRIVSEETKEKLSETSKRIPKRFGWHHTDQTRKKIADGHRGEKNHKWNDANPSYGAVHVWLQQFKHEKKKCWHCGGNRFLEWALRRGESHSHSREKYLILCSSCHKKYDFTPEWKSRISKSLKGRKITWAKKIGIANKSRTVTEETRNKISEWNKNHPRKKNGKGQFTI